MDDFSSLSPLEGGWSGETFLAEAGGARSVLRIFADPRHHPEAARIQEALLRLVRGLVPVPDVLEVRRADPSAGTPALLVTEFLPGVRGDLIVPTLDPEDLRRVGEQMGRIAGTLAGMPFLHSGTFADAELRVTPFDPDLEESVAEHEARLDWAEPDLAALRRLAAHGQEVLDGVGRWSLAHSDLNPKNLLVDPATLTVTGVLDWEFSHAGCPFTDLGNLLRFDRAPAWEDGVLGGYTDLRAGDRSEALERARAADLMALVELASRKQANPVAGRAHDRLLAMARSGDLHAVG